MSREGGLWPRKARLRRKITSTWPPAIRCLSNSRAASGKKHCNLFRQTHRQKPLEKADEYRVTTDESLITHQHDRRQSSTGADVQPMVSEALQHDGDHSCIPHPSVERTAHPQLSSPFVMSRSPRRQATMGSISMCIEAAWIVACPFVYSHYARLSFPLCFS